MPWLENAGSPLASRLRAIIFAGLVALIGWTSSCFAEEFRFTRTEPHMGTEFEIILYAKTPEQAEAAFVASFARIKELDLSLSSFQPDSEVNRLCQSAPHSKPVPLGRDLVAVLAVAEDTYRASHGAFDVTIGPLSRLWRRTRRTKVLPEDTALRHAREKVGFSFVGLIREAGSIQMTKSGMRIDLGAIAKGYAVDEVLVLLRAHGIRSALVNGGGDLCVSDAPPGRPYWIVAVSKTEQQLRSIHLKLVNRAVATSGDLYQFVEIGDVRYSHLIDPRTGLGLTHCAQASVVARKAIEADALATAVSILPESEAMQMIEMTEGVAARRTARIGDEQRTVDSRTFGEFIVEIASKDR